jgi:hypothetical protein
MATKKKLRDTSEKQSARFREAAKEAGLDESRDEFDKAFKKVTSKPAEDRSRPSGKRSGS